MPPRSGQANRLMPQVAVIADISSSRWRCIAIALMLIWSCPSLAGGGVVLSKDACIITIGFYTAHFTAYQPDASGNEEFCEDLPDTGESIFVLDYLHASLKEVPVDFRIIRNVTGLGRFVKWEDVQSLDNIEQHTVFYQSPLVRSDGSFRVGFSFPGKGEYIGIASAGHPNNDTIYYSVFPFSVGVTKFPMWLAFIVVGLLFVAIVRFATKGRSSDDVSQT